MKLTVYKLMIALPVPLALVVGYYLADLLALQIGRSITPESGKEFARLPDFELRKVEFNPEVVNVLSYIDIRKRKAEEVPKTAEKTPERPPSYILSFTYLGNRKSYAIINGMLVREGDILPSKEKVVRITREGVLLLGRWGRRWLRISE